MADKSLSAGALSADDESSLKYMLKLAMPIIVTYISFTVMQFVDRYMVSHVGTDSLAAILPAGIISFVPASFMLGVIACVNTFVGQSLGRGDQRGCSSYFWQASYLGLAYFAVVIAFMWPGAPWIFKVLGHEQSLTKLEVVYLRIMLYAQFPAVLIWSSTHFFMGVHRPAIMMYGGVAGHLVNIGANYILIFGKFGFPAMGLAGAGWGTFIGIAVEAVIFVAVFLGGPMNEKFKTRSTFGIDLGRIKDLIKVGAPAGLSFMVNVAFFGFVLSGLVGRFGKEALAATSVAISYTNLAIMPIVGVGAALTASVGKAIGKGRKDIAVRQTNVCLKAIIAYMIVMAACFIVFRQTLMGFWSSDEKVIQAGVDILILAAILKFFDAISITYSGSLRGAGDTVWLAMVSGVGSVVILGGGGLMFMKYFPGLGGVGPWIAATIYMAVMSVANGLRFRSNRWMRIDLFKRQKRTPGVRIEAIVE